MAIIGNTNALGYSGVMDTIFAPWRIGIYPGGKSSRRVHSLPDSPREEGWSCAKGKTAFVMVNRYPYTGGHLMIVPYRHLCCLGISRRGAEELFAFMDLSVRI